MHSIRDGIKYSSYVWGFLDSGHNVGMDWARRDFTSKCTIEAMHVHASDSMKNIKGAAKLFVYDNGDTKVERQGTVNEVDMGVIQKYIKLNYQEMYEKW